MGPGALVGELILPHTAAWPAIPSDPVSSHGLVLPALQLQGGNELAWKVYAARMWGGLLVDAHAY